MYKVSPDLDPEEIVGEPFTTFTAAKSIPNPKPGYTLWRINEDSTADEIGYWDENRKFVNVRGY